MYSTKPMFDTSGAAGAAAADVQWDAHSNPARHAVMNLNLDMTWPLRVQNMIDVPPNEKC